MLDLYAVRTEELPDYPELIRKLTLSVGGKRAEWERMLPDHAKESVAGILLLQAALSARGIFSASVCYPASGRPFVPDHAVDFNCSHTKGLAVCAVSFPDGERLSTVGVDAERMGVRSPDAMRRIADRWFSAAERERFSAAPDEKTFLGVWTGKEAIVKRSGEGLAGLKKADTLSLPSGIALTGYSFSDFIVTLCHSADEEPPSGIRWLSF